MKHDYAPDYITSISLRRSKLFTLALLLLPLLLWNCEDDSDDPDEMIEIMINCDTFPVPLIGTVGGDCISEIILDEDYIVFRGEDGFFSILMIMG